VGLAFPQRNCRESSIGFYRGDHVHAAEVEGSGLGLSIVQWIVKAHGGAIQLASTPEQWTTVTVDLPIPSDEALPG